MRKKRCPEHLISGSFVTLIAVLALFSSHLSCRPARPPAPPADKTPGPAHGERYLEALKALNGGDYAKSARLFDELIEKNPDNDGIRDWAYYLALSHYHLGNHRRVRIILESGGNPEEDRYRKLLQKLNPEETETQETIVPTVKAAQIFRLPPGDPAAFFREIKSNGFDTAILRVFHNPGDRYHFGYEIAKDAGVYFQTDQAPVILDILDMAVKRAHREGLKLYAWMTTREMGWEIPGKESLLEYRYRFADANLERGKGLDLFDERAVRYILDIYADLAASGVDGILFQDDLVMRHNVGFGPGASRVFHEKTGKTLEPDILYTGGGKNGYRRDLPVSYTEDFWIWSEIKARRILFIVEAIADRVGNVNPDCKIAMNVYYDTVINPRNGLAWLSRNIKEYGQSEKIDYFVVMAYHRQIARELNIDNDKAGRIVVGMPGLLKQWIRPPARNVIKLQTVDWKSGEPIPLVEVETVLDDLCERGPISIAVAPYEEDGGFPLPVKCLSPADIH